MIREHEVEVGGLYEIKISGGISAIKILNKLSIGKGWRAINTRTNRMINIRSSRRLRRKINPGLIKSAKVSST